MKFEYALQHEIEITMPRVRKTLREVQAQLLSHEINGGGKKLEMNTTTAPNSCGMAACIGGWTSLFLLGFDLSRDKQLEAPADELFNVLVQLDNREVGDGRLRQLFYEYVVTNDYDEPNVAATAIKRYLAGKQHPWPEGDMPNVMKYTRRAPAKKKR